MQGMDGQVFEQLRGMARARLAAQRPGHTLQPTALVAEAWLKLRHSFNAAEPTPAFYKVAADAMRQILIDHARGKKRLKRGGDGHRIDAEMNQIADTELTDDVDPDRLIALDAAIAKLETLDAQASMVVKLRFFAGLEVAQVAKVMSVSESTVKRNWQFARTWLAKEIAGDAA